jgi:transposase
MVGIPRHRLTGPLKNCPKYWTYSPELNLIEILWRFIKYEWLEIDAYSSWQSLVSSVEKILKEFGDNYVINFA